MRPRRLGFVLITVLFFVLVAGMIGRAMLIGGAGIARVGVHAQDELQAQRAAEAGAVYARCQLREKSEWKGDANAVTINTPKFKVVEDKGNVIGWIKDDPGQISVFRIRFNYQDGPGASAPGDMLDDPSPNHIIDNVFVSMNNVRQMSDAPLPRANPGGNWAVADPSTGPSNCPRGTAVVEIEGLSGAAVQGMTGPDDPRAPGFLMRRVLRVVYAAAPTTTAPDAVISGGNGIDFETSSEAKVDVIGTGNARLRSKKEVSVVTPNGAGGTPATLTMTGEVGRNASAGGLTGNINGSVTQKDEAVGDGNDFHNLKWSDVPVASTDEASTIQIPGGVYITDPTTGDIVYYDTDLAGYKAMPGPAGGVKPGGTVLNSNFDQVRTPANRGLGGLNYDKNLRLLKMNSDVNVKASASGVKDIVFTPLSGRQLHEDDTASNYLLTAPGDYSAAYSPGTVHLKNATLSSQGNMTVLTNVIGENGAITAEGDAVVAAPSVVFTQAGNLGFQQRLSMYVKKKLTVSTFVDQPGFDLGVYGTIPPYKGYAQLKLEGLIYSWGDAEIIAGTPGKLHGPGFMGATASNYGNVTIQGALVAYGGDPASSDPGGNGDGKVSVYGEIANIIYDITKLVADPTALPPAGIQGVKRISYGFEGQ